jgi:hypothetical protein
MHMVLRPPQDLSERCRRSRFEEHQGFVHEVIITLIYLDFCETRIARSTISLICVVPRIPRLRLRGLHFADICCILSDDFVIGRWIVRFALQRLNFLPMLGQ